MSFFPLGLVGLSLLTTPAHANEGAKPNGCPWAQDVTVEINGKTMTLNQAMFATPPGEPILMDPYKIYPLIEEMKLRIIGPKGREWEASLTRLVSGKRCSAFYVGKPFVVSDIERDAEMLILNR
ncbi:hypothetical protein [Azospirillum griseum]|uniref:hypothetical protein n=1 Tax=Azospirillum griseum TaxID=2496639 RepID=UPI001AECFE07|nr:hypothetical protein [Azospirillum griseum]